MFRSTPMISVEDGGSACSHPCGLDDGLGLGLGLPLGLGLGFGDGDPRFDDARLPYPMPPAQPATSASESKPSAAQAARRVRMSTTAVPRVPWSTVPDATTGRHVSS